jgi:SAM-dependent methyltransferase
VNVEDPDTARAVMRARWEEAAAGWGRRAAGVREWAMPVSAWLLEQLTLQPGQRVLELASGPGDTGFLAAELIQPGGVLISSDGAEAMVDVARARARELGIDNVEFRQLELEWIDLPAASVDAAVCRWGLMLTVDPAAALRECRRVIRPGGRLAVAVWGESSSNPWATIPSRTLIALGHTQPPDPDAPGPFALGAPGVLPEMLSDAGFTHVFVQEIGLFREFGDLSEFLREILDLSPLFAGAYEPLSEDDRTGVELEMAQLAEPYRAPDGSLRIPGRALVAAATA